MKKKAGSAKRLPRSVADPDLPRTEALLAQILLHSMGSSGQQKKALALRAAGFSNREIARLMGTTAAVVAQVLYAARRGGKSLRKSKPTKKRNS
jgi:DNA-directed RNA polymerase specialized sigma24 family protein